MTGADVAQSLIGVLGGSAAVVAGVVYVAKKLLDKMFERDNARVDHELSKQLADQEAAHESAMKDREQSFKIKLAEFQTTLESRTRQQERIRVEIARWANPVQESIVALRKRLSNLLDRGSDAALAANYQNDRWSIDREYLMTSTMYVFAIYFYWTNRMRLAMSAELFSSPEERKDLDERMVDVSKALGSYPLITEVECSGVDRQVFRLQQVAIGDAVALSRNEDDRPMTYHEFLSEWEMPGSILQKRCGPLERLVDELTPKGGEARRSSEGDRLDCVGVRLQSSRNALEHLERLTARVLSSPTTT